MNRIASNPTEAPSDEEVPSVPLPVAEQDHLPEPEQPLTGGSFIRHPNNRLERVEHPPVDAAPAVVQQDA